MNRFEGQTADRSKRRQTIAEHRQKRGKQAQPDDRKSIADIVNLSGRAGRYSNNQQHRK